MQVIRGTRAPFLAAAAAMLILGASAADSPVIQLVTAQTYISFAPPFVVGADGCPVLVGSTFDPRMLCAADLGADWSPVEEASVQLCPPGVFGLRVVLASGTVSVIEGVHPETDPASAVADVDARVRCVLSSSSSLYGSSRELPAIAPPGTATAAQVITDLRNGAVEIETIAAIGPAVLVVAIGDDAAPPDNATVMRIVDAAIQRFQNPRPSDGPFARVVSPTAVVSPAP